MEPVEGAEQHVHDPEGKMPGHLAPAATVQQEIWAYAQQKEAAKETIWQKLGEEVIISLQNEQVVWKVTSLM